MFGRNAASPETVALQLPNQPIDENDYAKYLVQRITEVHKLFCSIKKDLRRRQRDYYDLSADPREFNVGQEVLVRKPPPANVEKRISHDANQKICWTVHYHQAPQE